MEQKELLDLLDVVTEEHHPDCVRWIQEYNGLWREAHAVIEARLRALFDEIETTLPAEHVNEVGIWISRYGGYHSPISLMLLEYETAQFNLLKSIRRYLEGGDAAA